jgi:hypothetical protein
VGQALHTKTMIFGFIFVFTLEEVFELAVVWETNFLVPMRPESEK